MAILELLKKGEITPDQAKAFMVVVYRVPSYRMNIIEKPPGLFENMRNYE
jgi:polyhydroxyalkanoate synthesis regulator phasin